MLAARLALYCAGWIACLLALSLPASSTVRTIQDADIVLHIGPPNTANPHIQATARRYRSELYQAGWCYPVKSNNDVHALGLAVLNGRKPNVELVQRIRKCISDGKKVYLSSDKFGNMHTASEIKRVQAFFNGYKVHVLANFREPLTLSYAWHNQIFDDAPKVLPFTEHLSSAADRYLQRTFYAGLSNYADLFGIKNVTVIDLHGMIAAGEIAPSYVVFCELLGALCGKQFSADYGKQTPRDLRPSYLYSIVRSFVNSMGCSFNFVQGKEISTFHKMIEHYRALNISSLPMVEYKVEWFKHLARDIEKDFRQKFAEVTIYGDPAASEAVRQQFKAHELDEMAFFRNENWAAWAWKEVERLQNEGLVTKNCTVKVEVSIVFDERWLAD
eukprot:gene35010-42397_t